MKIAITGAKGQLGRCIAKLFSGDELLLMDLPEWDLGAEDLAERLAAESPELVIHAGAHTDVDGCTLDPQLAFLQRGF